MTIEKPVPLTDAVTRYRREAEAPSNALDWYRMSAAKYGHISIGRVRVPAEKVRNRWVVDGTVLDEGIASHREERTERQHAADDYERRVLRGVDGDTVRLPHGGYRVRSPFHFVWADYAAARGRSDGQWVCNRCWRPAQLRHDAPECHRCRDWSPCGNQCTLSEIRCEDCGAILIAWRS